MQIADKCMVSLHYELTNDRGELLDQSADGEPLIYMHGATGILPALATALTGKSAGDRFDVHMTPAEGFGELRTELVSRVPRDAFPNIDQLAVGMYVQGKSEVEEHQFAIIAMDDTSVTVDGNHPFAGMNLHFSGTVIDVRTATNDELTAFEDGGGL